MHEGLSLHSFRTDPASRMSIPFDLCILLPVHWLLARASWKILGQELNLKNQDHMIMHDNIAGFLGLELYQVPQERSATCNNVGWFYVQETSEESGQGSGGPSQGDYKTGPPICQVRKS